MLTAAIIFTVLFCIFGAFSLISVSDSTISGNFRDGLIWAIFHIVGVIIATVLYCLYSPEASLACGGLLTAVIGAIFIALFILNDNVGYGGICKVAVIMVVADFICGMASYINTFDFLAMGISCMVILILSFFGCAYTYENNESLGIVNIIFTIAVGITGIVGFIINATINEKVTVETECAVYSYDNLTSSVGTEEAEELYYNEYYAFKFKFNWADLRALRTKTQNVKIKITFPAGIMNYISDGPEFTSDSLRKVWTYELELNSKTKKQFESGYFILNYNFNGLNVGAQEIKAHIEPVKNDDDEEESGVFTEYEESFKFTFAKRNYNFGLSDCIKDLSFDEDGHYRITVPDGCKTFVISVYDSLKSGVYCEKTESLTDKYYSLDISAILKEGVTESVYNRITENKESVVVEIIAVGNSDFDDTGIEFVYTFE